MPESQKGRGDLWTTMTGYLLHASERCCSGGHYKRRRVRDASNPAFFDNSDFELCPKAKSLGASPSSSSKDKPAGTEQGGVKR